jgi:hypothetical protein
LYSQTTEQRATLFCCRENWLDPIPLRSSLFSQNSDDVYQFSKDGHEHFLKSPQIANPQIFELILQSEIRQLRRRASEQIVIRESANFL